MTTTTFIGDIKFKDGDTDRLVSDLATVDEVNEAFTKYYDKTHCDNTFALKSTTYTKTECDDKFALKGDGGNVDLSSYYTKTQCDGKYASKQQQYSSVDLVQYNYNYTQYFGWFIDCKEGDNIIFEGYLDGRKFYFESIVCDGYIEFNGRQFNFELDYSGTGKCALFDESKELTFTSIATWKEVSHMANAVYKNEVYTKTECDDKFALKNPSTTITHYAPIEEPIANYHIGNPTFMSGKVYKLDENHWILSTPTDSIDCICSCITTGNSKTFAGIITSIDTENNSITFATHGDYLFKVDDSTKYNIGDTICYDGSVIVDNTIPTIAIQQSIIGKVSSIVDDKTLAIFKTM